MLFWRCKFNIFILLLLPFKGHNRGHDRCISRIYTDTYNFALKQVYLSFHCNLIDDLQLLELDSVVGDSTLLLAFSHSHAIWALQLNSCTTVEKTAIVAGSEQRWEGSNILCRAKTTAMLRCDLAHIIFFFFFSWPCLPFVLRESCRKWLCLLWMIFSTRFEMKGGLITGGFCCIGRDI